MLGWQACQVGYSSQHLLCEWRDLTQEKMPCSKDVPPTANDDVPLAHQLLASP